jgi:hypothetical protein
VLPAREESSAPRAFAAMSRRPDLRSAHRVETRE